jgi:hypothetical protein
MVMIFYNYNQVRTFIILLVGFYLMLLPALLRAQVVINEIMYDPEGTDTGREWIEVYNSGTSDVDLATYKLFESNVNHKLTLYNNVNFPNLTSSTILKADGFAILADNPEKFLIDFPNFTGLLLDSTFSLNNTGEPLLIVDGVGATIDKFEYSGDLGATNNGNSLQRNETGFWIEAVPTVGVINKHETESPGSENSSSTSTSSTTTSTNLTSNTTSTHTSQVEITQYLEKSGLEIGAGRNRFVSLHTPVKFKAEYNTDKRPKFIWSWGDGSSDYGYKTSHIYENIGTYNIVLNALLNGYQATSRTKVAISGVSVDILYITYGKLVDIVLKNLSDKEVNLGGFIIEIVSNKFKIPTDTIIDGKSQITIPSKYTGFEISTSTDTVNLKEFLKLYYPDGNLYKEK